MVLKSPLILLPRSNCYLSTYIFTHMCVHQDTHMYMFCEIWIIINII